MSINEGTADFKKILSDFLDKESFIVEHRDKEIDLSKAVRSAQMDSEKLA